MKRGIFPKLARSGIAKNRRLYMPYILSCMGMVMMFYIVHFLSYSSALKEMAGGRTMEAILSLGKIVVAVFALIFLTYTNSFLMKSRYKEFGLYNVLGMDKKSIRRIVCWESVYIAAAGLAGGLLLGIAFSKIAELGLLNIVEADVDYGFTVPVEAILYTVLIFGAIFLFLLIKSAVQVSRAKPLELMKKQAEGEKPPKANWVAALLGAVVLIAAYWIAVTIKTPLTALTMFFVAVLMVIGATYLLFMAGSVALCGILKKNKKYYYQKNHFVSVSSMAYRMKRNGAGLASICILSTMVLVMLTSTSSLYFGKEEAIKANHPMDNEIAVSVNKLENLDPEKTIQVAEAYEGVFREYQVQPSEVKSYCYALISAMETDGGFLYDPDPDRWTNFDNLRDIYFVSTADYARMTGEQLTLGPDEALCSVLRCSWNGDRIDLNGRVLNIRGTAENVFFPGNANVSMVPSLCFIVPDYSCLEQLAELNYGGYSLLSPRFYYGYNLTGVSKELCSEIFGQMRYSLESVPLIRDLNGYSYNSGCRADDEDDFKTTYGGLFFIGIVLSILFIFAAAMIIYYKQISEGYEDRGRFEIMQKVGMTREDIRKNINSQVLSVFFAPLLAAGVHLAFAFPLVWKLLQLFNLTNLGFAIRVNVIAFGAFALFYALIYKTTAKSYYQIVSN